MFALDGNFAQASLSTARAHDAAVYRLLHLANQRNCAQHRMAFLLCTVEYWRPGPECSEQGGDSVYGERWWRVTDDNEGVLHLELAERGVGALSSIYSQLDIEQGNFSDYEGYYCITDSACWHPAPNTAGRSMEHCDGSEEMKLGVLSYLVAVSESCFKEHEIVLECKAYVPEPEAQRRRAVAVAGGAHLA